MKISTMLFMCFLWTITSAQETTLTLERAIQLALKNNPRVTAAGYEVEAQRQLNKTSFDIPKTEVSMLYGQYNSYSTNDNNITITQAIPFAALGSQAKLNRSLIASSELQKAVTENEMIFQVKQAYFRLAYAYALKDLLLQEDSIFEGFFKSASVRYATGESTQLEKTTAEVQRNDAKNRLRQNDSDIQGLRSQLRGLLSANGNLDIQDKALNEIALEASLDSTMLLTNPALSYSRQQIAVAAAEKKVQASKSAPDLLVGYFNQTLIGSIDPETGTIAGAGTRFSGFQIGLAIPLWFFPHLGRTRAAEFNMRAAEGRYISNQQVLSVQLERAFQEYQKNKLNLSYYKESGLTSSALMLSQSQTAFRNGEIGYAEYLLGLRNAIGIKENYLRTLNEYNQSILLIQYLSGNKSN